VNELVDRRILGAFVCVDAISGSSVANPISATAPQWTLKPNRSGVYVIFSGPGLFSEPGHDPLTTQFLPSGTWPGPVFFEVTLQDPNRRYLPRRASVQAPLKVPVIPPAPAGSSTNPAALAALQDRTSVFDPQRVALYPAPSAPTGPNWAVLHASVTRSGTTPAQGLPWAVLQVTRNSDNVVLATGQADASGEALLAVLGLGVQPSTSGTGPVTVSTVAATVKAFFDPGVPIPTPPGWIPNPDDILNNLSNPALKSSSASVQLGSGLELSMSFAISV
jgi:hypothetical protein